MTKHNKTIVLASLLSAGLVGGIAFCNGKFYKIKKNREIAIKNLMAENDSLSEKMATYNARRDFYLNAVAEHAEQNPNYDDMEKLFNLSEKLNANMVEKYRVLESRFVIKCKNAVYNSVGRNKAYKVRTNGEIESIKPFDRDDWMKVVRANAKKISNYSAIKQEYDNLIKLEKSLWEYEFFIGSDFSVYLSDIGIETRKQNKQRKVSLGDTLINNEVQSYNDLDNVKQNQIIDTLLNKYLNYFMSYGDKQMNIVDKKLFEKIYLLASKIREHNNFEAGVISYVKAMEDIEKKISQNNTCIANLQGRIH